MDFISLLIVAIGTFTAIWLLSGVVQSGNQLQFRARFSMRFQELRYKAGAQLNDSNLSKMLIDAQLSIRPAIYQYLRLTLSIVVLMCVIPFLHYSNVLLVLPVLMWMILGYTKPFPMYWVLSLLKKFGIARRNKELFLLYGLILQYMEVHPEDSISLYDVLSQIAPNLTVIQGQLIRCLTLWPRDPEAALTRFANEVGTEQATEFMEILRQIESSVVSTGLDTLQQRYINFQEAQIASFTVRLNVRSLFVFGFGIFGLAAIAFNDVTIMMNYAQSLMKMAF